MDLVIVTRGDPLQGIKRFVRIADIDNLEEYLQEARRENTKYRGTLPENTKNEKG